MSSSRGNPLFQIETICDQLFSQRERILSFEREQKEISDSFQRKITALLAESERLISLAGSYIRPRPPKSFDPLSEEISAIFRLSREISSSAASGAVSKNDFELFEFYLKDSSQATAETLSALAKVLEQRFLLIESKFDLLKEKESETFLKETVSSPVPIPVVFLAQLPPSTPVRKVVEEKNPLTPVKIPDIFQAELKKAVEKKLNTPQKTPLGFKTPPPVKRARATPFSSNKKPLTFKEIKKRLLDKFTDYIRSKTEHWVEGGHVKSVYYAVSFCDNSDDIALILENQKQLCEKKSAEKTHLIPHLAVEFRKNIKIKDIKSYSQVVIDLLDFLEQSKSRLLASPPRTPTRFSPARTLFFSPVKKTKPGFDNVKNAILADFDQYISSFWCSHRKRAQEIRKFIAKADAHHQVWLELTNQQSLFENGEPHEAVKKIAAVKNPYRKGITGRSNFKEDKYYRLICDSLAKFDAWLNPSSALRLK